MKRNQIKHPSKSQVKHRKKILIVLYYYHPYTSGVSVCAKRLAEGLVKIGHDVTVLTSRFDNRLPKEETIKGVRVVRRHVIKKLNKGVIMPTFWLDIIKYSNKNDYVNFHLPMADSGLSSIFIKKNKIVTTYQCDINLGDRFLDRIMAHVSMTLMEIQLKRSMYVVPSSRDYFVNSKMKKYINKSVPIYPIVTESEFKRVDPSPLFDRIGVINSDIKVGFVGRVVYEKGIDYLLKSIPYISKKISSLKIIIAGDYDNIAGGSTKDQLDVFIEKYPDVIIFTGFLGDKDLKRLYSGLDVLVLPSIDPLEAFGMVQIEAMLCGTPVVASNLPGVREIIKKTNYGRIARVRDPVDIANQVVAIIKNKEQYKPNREGVLRHFSSKRSIEQYDELMSKHTPFN